MKDFFAVTFHAYDIILERDVALKVIKNHTWFNERNLQQEVKPLIMLHHPNVIKYLDCGMFEGVEGRTIYYLATELANDGTLRDSIKSLTVEQSLDFVRQILQGLGACHNMKVIHRDLKPDNIFISGKTIKVGDLGIARISDKTTFYGQVQGTPFYMAPEQLSVKQKTSRRTDLWSVGIILYEMIYKCHPFQTLEQIEDPNYEASFPDFQNNHNLKQILKIALSKNETKRFQSTDSFLYALNEGVDAYDVYDFHNKILMDVRLELTQVDKNILAPELGSRILLYASPLQEIKNHNPSIFKSIPEGKYLVEGYYSGTIFGEEFWMSKYITVEQNQVNEFKLVRSYPIISGVDLYSSEVGKISDPQQIIPNNQILEIQINTFHSISKTELDCQVRMVFNNKVHSLLSEIDEISEVKTIGPGGKPTKFSFHFLPKAKGRYHFSLCLITHLANGNQVITDSWPWTPAFTIE